MGGKDSVQRTVTPMDSFYYTFIKAVLIDCIIMLQLVLCVVLHTVHSKCQKVQLQVNKFCMFRTIYLSHFLNTIPTHKVSHF